MEDNAEKIAKQTRSCCASGNQVALTSIAISLKRIADALEKQPETPYSRKHWWQVWRKPLPEEFEVLYARWVRFCFHYDQEVFSHIFPDRDGLTGFIKTDRKNPPDSS